jgi:hypothetical protein
VKRAAAAFAFLLGTLLIADVTRAEHEIYYRYTVLGYIKDAQGRPLAGQELKIVRDKTGFSYLGETDTKGLYVVVLRLGDESVGERLTVQTGALTTKVAVHFDVGNRTTERGTRLDVDGGRFVERATWFSSTLALYLGPAAR